MLYYTQVIFIKEGQEDPFNLFESHVLPLLERHNGTLLYRVRPTDDCVIETNLGKPYELHLVSFPSREDFEGYAKDNDRLKHMHLKEASIKKAMLIEGKLL
ncbi:MAG TPA: hypothetical protein VG367_15340 [Mucilaginibacter sp.]|jgi:hypothetical protein|nr:hypothetical protein [Mucilaginibacter sp.]